MKINWENELSYDMYIRLAECRNRKTDIIPMAKVIKKVMNKSSQEALDCMLEWICDWNNQIELYPTEKEYKNMLKILDK